MNDSCSGREPKGGRARKGERADKRETFWTCWTWTSDRLKPQRGRRTVEGQKTPAMEAEADADDGTFTNISLADDPGTDGLTRTNPTD